MSYNMERLSTGNNRQTITTSSLSDHAFFPDPEVTANCWQMTDGLRQKIREAHHEIAQIVLQGGIDFEGGDVIIDSVGNYLFWGNGYV